MKLILLRIVTLIFCTIFGSFLGWYQVSAQNSAQQNLYVQQATTQMQVISEAARLTQLETQIRDDEAANSALRDEVSTQKGVGIGIAAVIGLLQTLQMILQVKSGGRRGQSND